MTTNSESEQPQERITRRLHHCMKHRHLGTTNSAPHPYRIIAPPASFLNSRKDDELRARCFCPCHPSPCDSSEQGGGNAWTERGYLEEASADEGQALIDVCCPTGKTRPGSTVYRASTYDQRRAIELKRKSPSPRYEEIIDKTKINVRHYHNGLRTNVSFTGENPGNNPPLPPLFPSPDPAPFVALPLASLSSRVGDTRTPPPSSNSVSSKLAINP